MARENEEYAHPELVGGGETDLHSHSGGGGAGHIEIIQKDYASIGQGTWIFSNPSWSGYHGTARNYLYSADGDNVNYVIVPYPGTYTLTLLVNTKTDRGIIDVDIDAVEVASFDTYENVTTQQHRTGEQTGIAIAMGGAKTLKLRVDGKHPSSSGYYVYTEGLLLQRTG